METVLKYFICLFFYNFAASRLALSGGGLAHSLSSKVSFQLKHF